MSHSRFNDIKEVLSYPDLQIESEVRCDLICNFCAQIMNEACITMCGCNYCKQCIDYSLKNGGTQCPGQKEECKKYHLVYQKTIFPDHKTNIKIGRLIAKCPNRSCNIRTQLLLMKEHLSICNDKLMKRAWNDDNESYSSIISESINGMKSDIGLIKNKYEEQLELQMICIEKLNHEVNIFKEDSLMKQTRIEELEKLLSDLLKDVSVLKDNLTVKEDVPKPVKSEEIVQRVVNVELCVKELNDKIETLVYGEFLWKIDRFSKRRKEAEFGTRRQLDSDPFYSHKNGYKICLQINPNGYDIGRNTHLSLFFAIMKGPFDDILKWPFKHKVKMSLLNQKTGEDYTKQEYKYSTTQEGCKNSYGKPLKGNNVSLGTGQFILLEELINNNALVENDCIFIKCKIEPTA